MKKTLLSLILIFLAYFFTINHAYCEEDFFMGSDFQNAKNKPKISTEKIKKKWNIFSKKNKKDENEEQKGYWGTIPDIESDFKHKNQSKQTPSETNMKVLQDDEELPEENLKKAPFDDALFLDMVIKKQKDSNYLNDIQKSRLALHSLKKCIEENSDIQRFNAAVNMLDLYVQNLKKKYENESESMKESYIELLNTNYYAKTLGNLKYDANYYARYIPTNQGKYSKDNISFEEEKLLNRINKTIFLLNNET